MVYLAPVAQEGDSAIQLINLYLLGSAIGFHNTYLLDSDLSGGYCYPRLRVVPHLSSGIVEQYYPWGKMGDYS